MHFIPFAVFFEGIAKKIQKRIDKKADYFCFTTNKNK